MSDFIKEMHDDLEQFKNYIIESSDPKRQCLDDLREYAKSHPEIHVRDSVITHTGKKDTYLLFATIDSDKSGSYKSTVDSVKKHVKYDEHEGNWHSIYLPGDVFLALKEDKEIKESVNKTNDYSYIFNELVNILTEDSIYDYLNYDKENKKQLEMNTRRIDILNSQLKRGAITKDQFDKEYDKLKNVGNNTIPQNGSNNFDYNRPNKEKPLEPYKVIGNQQRMNFPVEGEKYSHDDLTRDKLAHYTNIMRRTPDYNEYKTAYHNFDKLQGNQNPSAIRFVNDSEKTNSPYFKAVAPESSANCTPDTKLYHTSKQAGITRLSGNYRSKDGVAYSSKRVYFTKDKPGGRNGYIQPGDHVYQYMGDPTKAYVDHEFDGMYGGNPNVYIKTDTSIPVKDVTDQFVNQKSESVDISVFEAATDTHIMKENLYPKVADVLSTPVGDRKFKQMVGSFMDRNSMKLHTAGPTYLIPFADRDKAEFFGLFKLDQKYVKKLIKDVTDKIGSGSQFKLLSDNPIYWVFYCCIRYYTMKKDTKGLNTALSIYALSNYPSVFHMSFPYPPNAAVMQYTMDNLSEKYIMKQAGHVFGGLFLSIQHSYEFLQPYMADASDKEIIRFIQRIRNDQKSMMKNICDQYMKNHAAGKRVKLNLDSHDGIQVDLDTENNTTVVQTVADNVVNRLITSGLDLRRVSQCKDIAQIGMADCRFYLSKIVSDKYTKDITRFIYSILFLFLYDEKKTKQDINSTYFLKWSAELFRKTNSNNPNIKNIKDTLDKWAEETGVHAKFKREASRVNYKKAIFWYFILSIQYFNK